ncbi:MAG: hypothetical protein KDJ34_20065, partial [Candidatus Competibacteraceae bacterium]|nr:hypothetical protein [Candidatus Competibacteraceae bacterium]
MVRLTRMGTNPYFIGQHKAGQKANAKLGNRRNDETMFTQNLLLALVFRGAVIALAQLGEIA